MGFRKSAAIVMSAALLLFAAAPAGFAQDGRLGAGGMFLAPTQLTLSPGAVGEIYVFNESSGARDFRVAVSSLLSGDADYADGGERLRFGPRQFSLPPGQSIAVRFTAKSSKAGAAPQRARIKVSMLPEVKPRDEPPESGGGVGFRVLGIYSISVPIDLIP